MSGLEPVVRALTLRELTEVIGQLEARPDSGELCERCWVALADVATWCSCDAEEPAGAIADARKFLAGDAA